MKTTWPFAALRWSYALFIAYASAQSFLAALGTGHHGGHVLVLSAVEFLAALALLVERLIVPATAVLVVVFTVAAVLTGLAGELPLRFVYYAATAIVLAQPRAHGLTA